MKKNNNLKNTYNKIAKDWHKDHILDNWWQEGTDKYISYFKKGDSVLDMGCASGVKSKYLIDKGLKVLGIDFSEKFIEIAKKEVLNGNFLVMDINDIDKLTENFDGIFIQAVLLHIPKKEVENILKKAVNKLNKGGYLYVAVKGKKEDGADEEIKNENDYGYEYERFFSYFSIEELKDYFKKVGLKIIYKNISQPSRATRKTNWIQIIGKK
ncbi:MAG TPA: class I SAM-dependent methyltransferase [Candidatus Paceibacterota bacterium]